MNVPQLHAPSPSLRSEARETLVLDDGREIVVAPVTPAARPLIERGIERVSAESSRRRFFTVRHRFSDRELDQMTRMDGWRRFALGAVSPGPEGAGIARFARSAADPRAAEVAVLVVDAWQGVGLGRRLMARIAHAALERGIERLTGIVLPDNDPMLGMLRRHAPGLALVRTGDHLSVEVRLDARRIEAALGA